jgi:hypothetical protein
MSEPLSQVLGIEAKKRKLNSEDLSNLKGFMNRVGGDRKQGRSLIAYQK